MNMQPLVLYQMQHRHDGKLRRTCHNVWVLRGLPLAVFQRRMCFLHLQSCEPIIKCSAYEAGIYFKLLCQYFCLKAGLIPVWTLLKPSITAFYLSLI